MRNQYNRFVLETIQLEPHPNLLKIQITYNIPGLDYFNHTVEINHTHPLKIDTTLTKLIHNIALAEALSYWKLTAAPQLLINTHGLTQSEQTFWQWVYTYGMSEFHYHNQLEFWQNNFITFSSIPPIEQADQSASLNGECILSGGGKDSSLTLNLLKNHTTRQAAFVLETNHPIQSAADIAAVENYSLISTKRTLDPKLFGYNTKGFYNGHVPFSLQLAFIALAAAYLDQYQYVIASNESSANEPTLLWHDQQVNHQIAKSYQMETRLQQMLSRQLPAAPTYFSILRPLSELQIATLFSKLKPYHHVAISCNRGQKRNRWCGTCAKCAFSYAILFPFFPYPKLSTIFGSDLFSNSEIIAHLSDNCGLTDKKPFECVGTREETAAAIILSWHHYQQQQPPEAFTSLYKQVLERNPLSLEQIKRALSESWNNQHSLNDEYQQLLKHKLKELSL